MARTSTLIAAALAVAGNVASAAKLLGTEKMSTHDIAQLTKQVDKAVLEAHACKGQSCLIADTAGSTGRIPFMKAEGAGDDDIKCIISYNKEVGQLLQAYNNNPPLGPKQPLTGMSSFVSSLNNLGSAVTASTASTEGAVYSGSCAPNILIFAKGTLEPGEVGVTIGPQITKNMPSGWTYGAVPYTADIRGDYCLGLPGGAVATKVINDAARKCPNSKLFLSGYSQGAMVIRNGLAHADPSAVAKVKGVVTFGDPFNGANIIGYNGPIKIFCVDDDGVCSGNFELRPAHLSYPFGDSVEQAWTVLQQMAQGKGDQSCCIRGPPPSLIPSPEQWAQTIKANGGVQPLPAEGTTVEAWGEAIANSNGGIPKGTVNTPGATAASDSSSWGGLFGRDVGDEQ